MLDKRGKYMVEITIRGKVYQVTSEQIIDTMKEVEPNMIQTYYVLIEKKHFPVKQVIRIVLGIPLIAFTSLDAYRLLDKLGFEIGVRGE